MKCTKGCSGIRDLTRGLVTLCPRWSQEPWVIRNSDGGPRGGALLLYVWRQCAVRESPWAEQVCRVWSSVCPVLPSKKAKFTILHYESVGRCSSPSPRPWACRWRSTNVRDTWPVWRQNYTVTFPAARRHCPLAGTKLYCSVTEAHVC